VSVRLTHDDPRRQRRPGWLATRSSAGTALILLVLIMVPSAVLGFLSWRAIQNEKSYSLERLKVSYRQYAILAARQMDYQLSSLESRWISQFDGLLATSHGQPTSDAMRQLEGREPLIARYFLLNIPGRILYPPGLVSEEVAQPDADSPPSRGPEREPFARLVTRGEELEYGAGDLAGALAVYRQILAEVRNPRLRGMAESYAGRVQLKSRDWDGALATFRALLLRYPEVRDLDRMYLRFLAQYQIAIALHGLGRDAEALDALLELNADLLRRSDAITSTQYTYYADLIQSLLPQLMNGIRSQERERYALAFRSLGEQSKKRISERYFVHLLDAELSEMSFRQKRYSPRIRYMSARAEGVPFLLAYRALPDAQDTYATGILAAQIDLGRLQAELFSAMRGLHTDPQAAVAILGAGGNAVLGAEATHGLLMAEQDLAPPFDGWRVAIYLRDVPTAMRQLDVRNTLWTWLITVMLLSILMGAYVFIARARRQARLSRAQTTFVSNVTHELRTPLTSIRMFAELLELQMGDTPEADSPRSRATAAEHLRIIRQESERLSRLIDRVLDFSRIERHMRQYRFEPHDLVQVVSTAVDAFRPQAEGLGFSLQYAVDGSFPAQRLDPDALSQVMHNLLTNAVQYSRGEKEILVRLGRRGANAAIEVSDRGVGIEHRNLERIFDKFFSTWQRMDDRAQGGLGLGLTLSREIVRAHGGEISVRSEVGQGSTFTVSLPLQAVDAAPMPAAQPASEDLAEARLGGQRG